ncbi:hypothetical protein LTR10_023878 [Elasticomyces elasticus]|uniref:Glutaminase A n=1 Tax=Exophiala sideris TaxID=1016849 RepID=A0ABR0J0Y5_9EURO|nr:hypothetical protein LTR10_023878 [Elasticomyces elasticus]KAK5023947.1 hypothetical protein LTS07_009073 [Exophiala sideris]KAK5030037.1 hypothetical protein LTR13_008349 [Exophiala sideris]KAK5053532.1 hypothetical protein LTR69_009176 [Exophiala sideris]KAK5179427.1 hypothetical protein LTR44_008266 [Eurotiomycetes sp. CCFEE 6388]
MVLFHMLGVIALISFCALAQDPYSNVNDSNYHRLPSYSPAKPPAVPLAVRSPYTHAWQSTAGNSTLNSGGAQFWTGGSLGWEGIVTVDGISYEYLGIAYQTLPVVPVFETAVPLTVAYDSQYSNYTFQAGPVLITASFFSPVIPKDLCRTSIPLSYLTTSVESVDGSDHDVQLYSDVNGNWIAPEGNKTLNWDLYRNTMSINGSGNATDSPDLIYTWLFNLSSQYQFAEESQLPLWGNFSYTTSPGQASNFSFQNGYSANLRFNYIMQHYLADDVDSNYRGAQEMEPVFAFAHDFGSTSSASVRYTLGSSQTPIMRYLTSSGVQALQPWWTNCYGDLFSMIAYHYTDYDNAAALGNAFEAQLKSDIDAFYAPEYANTQVYSNSTPSPPPVYPNQSASTDEYGQQYYFDPNTAYGFLDPTNFTGVPIPEVSEPEAYYSFVALAARQIMGAYVLTVNPSPNTTDSSPLMFQKEISSDGNVNTVDVMYPAMPFFLYANPSLLAYNLNPLFYNQESGFYPNSYSMHDLGSNFPNATGHVEGNDEYMPVEESGNMIIMTYAYYALTGDTSYLSQHYPILQQWSEYLIEYSLLPGQQLSTDDFAGQLANQTNLAIKGIVGLACMAEIASATGNAANATTYTTLATEYFNNWTTLAIDPSGHHTMLGYQWRSSWGLLYNIFPARLLSLPIIPDSIYDMQCTYYPSVSQIYGVPLDNRHALTKSDWELWTAATCSSPTRRLFVNALAYWLNETDTSLPFTDLYLTIDEGGYPNSDTSPTPIEFIARPVQGGLFSLLAMFVRGGSAVSFPSQNSSSGTQPSISNNATTTVTSYSLPVNTSWTSSPATTYPVPSIGTESANLTTSASTYSESYTTTQTWNYTVPTSYISTASPTQETWISFNISSVWTGPPTWTTSTTSSLTPP